MIKIKYTKFFTLFHILLALCLGQFLSGMLGSTSDRTIASKAIDSKIGFNELPCPTLQEWEVLEKDFTLINFKSRECNDSYSSKLGRFLVFIKSIETNVPTDWELGALDALKDPYQFLVESIEKIEIDEKESRAIGYYSNGKMTLTPVFFRRSLALALQTIIHEAQHANRFSPDHGRCLHGDMPGYMGACDDNFTASPNDGAYAYEVSFAIGLSLFAKNLPASFKEEIEAVGMSVLSTRINNYQSDLTIPYSNLVALSDSGELYQVTPFTLSLVKLNTDDTPVEKIKFAKDEQAPFVIYRNGSIDTLESNKLVPFIKSKRTKFIDVEDVTWRTDNGHEGTATYYLSNRSRLLGYIFGETNSKRKEPLPLRVKGPSDIKSIHYIRNSAYALTKNGKLLYFNEKIARDKNKYKYLYFSKLNNETGGWKEVRPGLFYNDFFLIDKNEILYKSDITFKSSYKYLDNLGSSKDYIYSAHSLESMYFNGAYIQYSSPELRVRDFIETAESEYLVLATGEILIRDNSSITFALVPPPIDDRFKQIIISPKILVKNSYKKNSKDNICDIQNRIPTPWDGIEIGVSDAQIILKNIDDKCINLSEFWDLSFDVESVEFEDRIFNDFDPFELNKEKPKFVARKMPGLKVTLKDGRTKFVYPYQMYSK